MMFCYRGLGINNDIRDHQMEKKTNILEMEKARQDRFRSELNPIKRRSTMKLNRLSDSITSSEDLKGKFRDVM